MSKVISNLTITADGFAAGHDQTEDRPFGADGGDGWGDRLHAWAFDDREGNEEEAALLAAADAFIMGRNMFGPVRGEWDREWNGWWGDDPPYHGPVFVLTHHPRVPQPMEGGTTFHFVTDGIEAAMARAHEIAGERTVAVAAGTIARQCLELGLLDEVAIDLVPVVFGGGRPFFGELSPGDIPLGDPTTCIPSERVIHLVYPVRRT